MYVGAMAVVETVVRIPAGDGTRPTMFDGFTLDHIDVGEGQTARVRHGGSGPPVVLLHGHPRTHATWHAVAPRLVAAGHTVVCPDLRGYGGSSVPPDEPEHAQASKRAMARDVVTVMRRLGHERFAVVGHDRGGPVAYRLAFDHPCAVSRLVVADCVPIGEHLRRADARFATLWWHWFFLGREGGLPERLLTPDPGAFYRFSAADVGDADAYADILAATRDPATIHAMCEDYRAGLTADRAADDADWAAGRVIGCPTYVLWSGRDDMETLYGDVVAVWRRWAADVRGGRRIESGHHMAEQAPGEVAGALIEFLADL
jgi:haloacetate dehalogenase